MSLSDLRASARSQTRVFPHLRAHRGLKKTTPGSLLRRRPAVSSEVESEHIPAIHALLQLLEAEGVEYIFGVPGGPLTALFEAIQERNTIKLVLAKHEGGAAFMAASHARVRRGLAVCCATTGPGATNALTGIASAQADSLPVLFLTGQVGTNVFGKGAIQESSVFGIDLVALFEPVTKLSAMFPSAERIPDMVKAAIRVAKSGRPGAVHLNMPADMLRRPVSVRAVSSPTRKSSRSMDWSALQTAFQILAQARRPAILAGHGVALAGASDALARFAHASGIPVMTSPKGKGVFPETDPLWLGVLGFGGHELAEKYLQSGAIDALLVIGSSLNEFVTNAWSLPIAAQHKLIQLDVDPTVIGRNHNVDVAVAADARTALTELTRLMECGDVVAREAEPLRDLRASTPRYLVEATTLSEASPLKPQRLMTELRRAMPDDALLFVDNGTSIIWGVHYFQVRERDTFFIDLGLASMGSAVAGVVGGGLAAPGRRSVALVGDAAFAMNGFEVHTAVEQKLPIVWVVLNNNGHGMVHQGDKLMRGRDLGASQFVQRVDSAGVARSLGARGVQVSSPVELRQALVEAFRETQLPTVIDAIIDAEELAPTLARRVQTLAGFMSLKRSSDIRSLIGG
ncbi:MAG: thiamine pyrophosphate-binding protein [Myxococcales bacterium]|nr:MAG: thiamine pyrophosphate-binding protein [Myxococcales bacterium]